jgi:hypothetical protein
MSRVGEKNMENTTEETSAPELEAEVALDEAVLAAAKLDEPVRSLPGQIQAMSAILEPRAVNLKAAEKKRQKKAGVKLTGFSTQALNLSRDGERYIPVFVNAQRWTKAHNELLFFRGLRKALLGLLQTVDNIISVLADEALDYAWSFNGSLKEAAKRGDPKARFLYGELSASRPNTASRKQPKASTAAPPSDNAGGISADSR